MIVCSYSSSCIGLPVALVDFQIEGCRLHLTHVCKAGYVAMNEINLDGGEKNHFRNCVDKIHVRGKSETLKEVVDSTVYGTDKSEEDEE